LYQDKEVDPEILSNLFPSPITNS